MDPTIIELIDRINGPIRSALAIADLLSCSDGYSLLDETLSDIGTMLLGLLREAKERNAELYELLRNNEEPPA